MGYRSDVRSLIYGDPDLICALVAKTELLSRPGSEVMGDVTRYRIVRALPDAEPLEAHLQTPGPVRYKTVIYEVIDLDGQDWKWYPDYPDVQAWNILLEDAVEMGLNTEFMRIGEERDDNEFDENIQDDGDSLLSFQRDIVYDGPDHLEEPAAA